MSIMHYLIKAQPDTDAVKIKCQVNYWKSRISGVMLVEILSDK